MINGFLPVSRTDMQRRGWDELDFLFISGDAYVDHPSFGMAIITRVLADSGYRVGIIAQPDWHNSADFKKLGRPRLGVLISAGNLDSMLNKYTAAKKYRNNDSYSPGGRAGLRPERATIVYSSRVREAFPGIPVIIGGIEASLRRFAHYDYWSDKIRRSILMDSSADILIYGMGERQIVEIAAQLRAGISVADIRQVAGTSYKLRNVEGLWDYITLPSYADVCRDKKSFAEAFRIEYLEHDHIRGKVLVQDSGDAYIVQNPPAAPLTTAEMDKVYSLPYERACHPMYGAAGVPAINEVKFSLVSHRGCFGACSFCAIVSHQGRIIQQRSVESILTEARLMIHDKDFKGYIHDVGGPTANFRHRACEQQLERGACRGRQCMFPEPCRNLDVDHSEYLSLLRSLRKLPGVKKVFVRSGLRYDYLLAANDKDFLRELCEHHVSGQLKIAPEHVSNRVLKVMGKAGRKVYLDFVAAYKKVNAELGKAQFVVPYFMSSHPGSELKDAIELAEFLRDEHCRPEQVQDFIPTPGSLSTCIYYTGMHPLTGEKVYVPRSYHEKQLQRALLQYSEPKNYALVQEALLKAGRQDLIGYGAKCLIRPSQQVQRHKPSGKFDPRQHVSRCQKRQKKTGY